MSMPRQRWRMANSTYVRPRTCIALGRSRMMVLTPKGWLLIALGVNPRCLATHMRFVRSLYPGLLKVTPSGFKDNFHDLRQRHSARPPHRAAAHSAVVAFAHATTVA